MGTTGPTASPCAASSIYTETVLFHPLFFPTACDPEWRGLRFLPARSLDSAIRRNCGRCLRKVPAVQSSLLRGIFFGAFIPAIALHVCYGLPSRYDGSLDERRHGGPCVVFVVQLRRQPQRGQLVLQFGQREPVEQQQSRERFLRALRPASKKLLFYLFATMCIPCGCLYLSI